MAKIVKFTKIPKTLKAPLFMFSPSRAGGSFLSHEGGEKASDGKMNSRESHVEGSCEGYCVFNHLPDPSRRRDESTKKKKSEQRRLVVFNIINERSILASRRSLRKAESEDASTVLWGVDSLVSMSIDKGTIRRKFT